MMERLAVYGIGNAIMDIQMQISEEEFADLSLTKGTMQLVTPEEQRGLLKKLIRHELNHACGGSAANTIIAIRQLGGDVAYGCLVGEDDIGKDYHSQMSGIGVHTHVDPVPSAHTGTCLIFITPDAERTMNTSLGVSAAISPEHVSQECIEKAEWLYIEGYLLASPSGKDAALKAAELAKQKGTKVALTFSDPFIVNGCREALDAVIPFCDLIFANELESQSFSGFIEPDEVFQQMCASAPNVVMTMHDQGVRVFFEGHESFTPAIKVNAVDSTGAGDMFAGAFLYGITHGLNAEESSKLACFMAGKIVAQLGPRFADGIDSIEGLEELLP